PVPVPVPAAMPVLEAMLEAVPAAVPAPAAAKAAQPMRLLDAQPVIEPVTRPSRTREEVARAIVAAQVARNRDWRWGLLLAGIITGSITAAPFVGFGITAFMLPRTPANTTLTTVFLVLSLFFGVISAVFASTAIIMGKSRNRRRREACEAVATAVAK